MTEDADHIYGEEDWHATIRRSKTRTRKPRNPRMSAVSLTDRLGTALEEAAADFQSDAALGLLIAGSVYLVLAIASIEVNWARVAEGLSRGWAFIIVLQSPISSPAAPISGTAWSKASS
jgi:asparagine N-glycosylation enzyme membrane subunit Stt3